MFAVDIDSRGINHMPDRLIEKLSNAQAAERAACHPSPLHHLMFNYVKTAFRSSALRIDGSCVASGAFRLYFSTIGMVQQSRPAATLNIPRPGSLSGHPHCSKLNSSSGGTGASIHSLLLARQPSYEVILCRARNN